MSVFCTGTCRCLKGRRDAGAAIKRHFEVYPTREHYDPY